MESLDKMASTKESAAKPKGGQYSIPEKRPFANDRKASDNLKKRKASQEEELFVLSSESEEEPSGMFCKDERFASLTT